MTAQEQQPYLQIRHLYKMFGTFVALADVSMDVVEGEFICFLGPSGCGKTTLLRCIAGLEEQNSGQIIQAGRDISRLPPAARDFGIVFQSYALFPNLTATQNVAYGLENKRLLKKEVRARVEELLTLMGLLDMGHKYPAQLSGGQQQRIALARALALSPGLLLLDEPLSALDARVRASLRGEITRLQRRLGVTTIMVTHDQEEALTMADRIVVMDQGIIVQIGTPEEVYRLPATPYVANFVGLMNSLPGQIEGKVVRCGDVTLTAVPPSTVPLPAGPVTIAIRPEDVRIAGVSLDAPNSFLAQLNQVEFLGSFYRLHLGVNGNTAVSLVVDLLAGTARDLDLRADSSLPVQLPADCLHLFAAGDREEV